MKVCPSCNARVADDVDTCRFCDHDFRSSSRRPGRQEQKKTMMGLPSVGEDGRPKGQKGGKGEEKQTLFGIPAVAEEEQSGGEAESQDNIETAMVNTDSLSLPEIDLGGGEEDDSTRQVDLNELAGAISQTEQAGGEPKKTMMGAPAVDDAGPDASSAKAGTSGRPGNRESMKTMMGAPAIDDVGQGDRGDEEASAMAAWGLDDDSDDDVAATEVMSPDALDLDKHLGGGAARMDQNQKPKVGRSDGPPQTNPRFRALDSTKGQKDEKAADRSPDTLSEFGTLMGMSVDEEQGGGTGAGAMQQGGREDLDSGQSTQALSPDQLAKIEEMDLDLGDDVEDIGDITQVQQPGGGDDETAILDTSTGSPFGDSRSGKQRGGATSSESASSVEPRASSSEGDESKTRRSAPQSGVFRAAKRKRPKTDPPEDSSPQTGNFSESPVTGTGTYNLSKRKTDTGSSASTTTDEEENIAIGGVGSGGARTSFPTGRDTDDDGERKKVRKPAPSLSSDTGAARSEPSTKASSGSAADTGPRFKIGGTTSKSKTSAKTESASSPGPPDIPVPSASTGPGISQKGDDKKAAQPGAAPLDMAPDALADKDTSKQGPSFGARPASDPAAEKPSAKAAGPSFGAEPADEPVQPGPPAQPQGPSFGAKPADEPVQPGPPAQPQGPSFGAEPADEPVQPGPPAQPQGASFGAEPAREQAPPASPVGQQGPPAGAGIEGQAPTGPASSPQAQEQREGDSSTNISRVIGIFQRGFGALAGLTMVALAVVAVVLSGLPDGGNELGAMAGAVVLGLMSLLVTALPVGQGMRTAGYGLIGLLAIAGFVYILLAGLSELLVLGTLAGALLLGCALVFPLFGKVLDNS